MAFYWYERDPELYKAEVQAMRKFFPSFKIDQLQDGTGRLYWRGTVQPSGPNGIVWDLMLIYKNNHPYTAEGEYGGSIQILPITPRLKDIAKDFPIRPEAGLGLGIPHVYRGNFGRNEEYFICTADPKYFKAGQTHSTSAASALSWACKWIILFEMWINGEIDDSVALEGNF